MRQIQPAPDGALEIPLNQVRIRSLAVSDRITLSLGDGDLRAEVAIGGELTVESDGETLRIAVADGTFDDLPAVIDAVLWQTVASAIADANGALEIRLVSGPLLTTTAAVAGWTIADNCGMVVTAVATSMPRTTAPDREPPAATPEDETVATPLVGESPGRWSAVRCIVALPDSVYEERVTIWCTPSADEAIALAEAEAVAYEQTAGGEGYLGLAQEYDIEAPAPAHGTLVYALKRVSSLDPQDYLDTFYDTGDEEFETVDDDTGDETADADEEEAAP